MKVAKVKMPIDNSKYDGYGPSEETRYVIIDSNGKTIDDAQGYGYKTYDKAMKAMWWKFKDGKKKSNDKVAWWKKHKELWHAIDEFTLTWFKEMMRGEVTDEEVNAWCKDKAKEMGIDMPDEMLKFAFSKVGLKMIGKEMEK